MVDDIATRKTYRYLRIGMVGAVVLLGASVLLEQHKAPGDCWQTSISAYYYTPVRAVFVGALMAIGLSLIVIKGSTWREDACLNLAGMLAPVVALVPTSDHGDCWSLKPHPLPTIENPLGDDPLAGWVKANIHNNIEALLYAAAVALVAVSVIAVIAVVVGRRRGRSVDITDAWKVEHRGTFFGLLGAAAFVVFTALAFYHWRDFETRAHGYAAVAMFGALALAAAVNSWECRKFGRRWYFRLYFGIAVLMLATGLVLFGDWRHKVLVVEALEIVFFAGFWIVQTRELWHDTVRGGPGEAL